MKAVLSERQQPRKFKNESERIVMTLFKNLNQIRTTVLVLSTAVLAGGCCGSKSSGGGGGSYSYTPPPYSSTPAPSGAAETKTEMAAGDSTVIPLYEESLAVGTRKVEEGTVRLKKVVTTETVNQPIQLRRESVVIERQPASGQASAPANAFQEGQETVIQLWREEPVVETRVVSSGQIAVQRKSEVEQSSVQRELRKESIDVDKSGDSQNVTISDNVMSSAGGTSDSASQATGKASGGTITEISTLTSGDPSTLAQRSVRLSNVKVEKVISSRVVEVQDDGGRSCFVRLNETMPNVKGGDTINVAGTVKPIPATMSDLGLGDDVKQALKGQQIFVDAQKFEVTNR
jgi:uncharacterized protein (TIGR02271 family)